MYIPLTPTSRMPHILGVDTPHDFYQVIDRPAPLAGMIFPASVITPWEAFSQAGYQWVVCLSTYSPLYDPSPLKRLTSIRLDDLAMGTSPAHPTSEEILIKHIADHIHQELVQGSGVIVHSEGGTGRTGTVLGLTLCALGYGVEEVILYLNYLALMRRVISGWPQTPWQAQLLRKSCVH